MKVRALAEVARAERKGEEFGSPDRSPYHQQRARTPGASHSRSFPKRRAPR